MLTPKYDNNKTFRKISFAFDKIFDSKTLLLNTQI
jgi:hypothetical protein